MSVVLVGAAVVRPVRRAAAARAVAKADIMMEVIETMVSGTEVVAMVDAGAVLYNGSCNKMIACFCLFMFVCSAVLCSSSSTLMYYSPPLPSATCIKLAFKPTAPTSYIQSYYVILPMPDLCPISRVSCHCSTICA